MADKSTETETIVEVAVHSMSDLRQVRHEERTRNRRANHSRFDDGLRHRYRGVSNPPGRPRARTGRRIGGLLTPPFHQRGRLSGFVRGTERRACCSASELASSRRRETYERRARGHRFIDHRFRLTTYRSRGAPTIALRRGSPRGVSRSNPKAGTSVKRASRIHQVPRKLRVEITAGFRRTDGAGTGANTLSAVA
jgi:hypothetical protein